MNYEEEYTVEMLRKRCKVCWRMVKN